MTDEPKNLAGLLHWYRDMVGDRIPARLHDRDTDGGGNPQWHSAFRAYLTAHPRATDREGYVRDPLSFWLWTLSRSGGKNKRRAEFLYRLAVLDFDWLEAVHARRSMSKWADDMAEDYALASLRKLWRMCQTEPQPHVREPRTVVDQGKSEAQHHAEGAA